MPKQFRPNPSRIPRDMPYLKANLWNPQQQFERPTISLMSPEKLGVNFALQTELDKMATNFAFMKHQVTV